MPGEEKDIISMDDQAFLDSMNDMPDIGDPPAEEVTETPEPATDTPTEVPEEVPQEETGEVPSAPATDESDTPPEEFDYKAAYEAVIGKPFKANGKEMVVNTPEEAIQLMQMGAGYHKKMSQLGYANRIIETLRENELLDENKINNLIDISKKNPEAIAALVRSAGIDPLQLDLDGDNAPTYTPGNHVLPEDQIRFRTSVENIREQGGEEFLTHVAQDWDVTSRAEIFKDPRALDMLYEHKQSGIYDKVFSEVERRKMFDPGLSNVPLIQAYLAVGNEMNERGLLGSNQQAPAVQATTPVAVKPAVTPQSVAPNPAAARAASVRSSTTAKTEPNFLTMSDEEFMKHHSVS